MKKEIEYDDGGYSAKLKLNKDQKTFTMVFDRKKSKKEAKNESKRLYKRKN